VLDCEAKVELLSLTSFGPYGRCWLLMLMLVAVVLQVVVVVPR
jgi:hypothetical protein